MLTGKLFVKKNKYLLTVLKIRASSLSSVSQEDRDYVDKQLKQIDDLKGQIHNLN